MRCGASSWLLLPLRQPPAAGSQKHSRPANDEGKKQEMDPSTRAHPRSLRVFLLRPPLSRLYLLQKCPLFFFLLSPAARTEQFHHHLPYALLLIATL